MECKKALTTPHDISAEARLIKIHNTTLGAVLGIFADYGKISVKLSESLTNAGFPLQERRAWSKDGVPDIAPPTKVKNELDNWVNAYRDCDLPILDNSLTVVQGAFSE